MIPVLLAFLWLFDVRGCACDPAQPETMLRKECSLCKEAEAQPAAVQFFFLKDANPNKPNRTLILPKAHQDGSHSLSQMSAAERNAWWTAGIAKAKELWGGDWGIAYNGEERRTQCHGHMHIGKIAPDAQKDGFVIVDTPADIPVPPNGAGLWIHGAPDGKIYVHGGEQVTEFNLMR